MRMQNDKPKLMHISEVGSYPKDIMPLEDTRDNFSSLSSIDSHFSFDHIPERVQNGVQSDYKAASGLMKIWLLISRKIGINVSH